MFFFSWCGKGYLVPLSAALSTLGIMWVTDIFAIAVPDQAITAAAGIVSGIFVWKLHYRLQQQGNLTLIDAYSGESVPYKTRHDFLWVPLKYWGIAFFLFGSAHALQQMFPQLVAF